ncbi:MAG TPA: glycosyltransferase family 39 protein, partial [Methylomirabilota bacterium]|nr:glycosyltransferase family 39 protein [Methylomirabilota bacterium]
MPRRDGRASISSRRLGAAVGVLLILGLAAWLRYERMLVAEYHEQDPDVTSYTEEAKRADRFYHISVFEPLFIVVTKGTLLTIGERSHYKNMRVQSIGFGLLAIVLTYLIGVRLSGRLVGLGAAFLMATNELLVFNDQRGLKEQLYISLMLLLTYVLFLRRELPMWSRYALAGVVAGAMVLVRITGLQIYVMMLVMALLVDRGRWSDRLRWAAVSVGLVGLIIGPYLYGCARVFGDPLISINWHASYWRNAEFGGLPGFPSKAQLAVDMHAGPPISAFDYAFRLHSPREVAARYLLGYRMAVGDFLIEHGGGWPYLVFGAVGLAWLAARGDWPFAVLPLVAVFPVVFTVPVGSSETRFVIPILPFFVLAVARGLVGLAGVARALAMS